VQVAVAPDTGVVTGSVSNKPVSTPPAAPQERRLWAAPKQQPGV